MAPSYEKAWWLTDDEKAALRAGYNSSGRGEEHDAHFTWTEVFSTFKVNPSAFSERAGADLQRSMSTVALHAHDASSLLVERSDPLRSRLRKSHSLKESPFNGDSPCFTQFAPTIVGTFGYSPVQTQLHSVPPYAVVFVVGKLQRVCPSTCLLPGPSDATGAERRAPS